MSVNGVRREMIGMLHGKTAVITGANRGIGLAIAQLFAAQGARVIACMRAIESETIKKISPEGSAYQASGVSLDLADETSIKAAIKEIGSLSTNQIDVLVNNGGTASGGLFQLLPLAELSRVFQVNFMGQIMLTQGLARLMTRRKSGSIINIASTAAEIADIGTMAYGASKAAFSRASQSMATELGSSGIRVNTISPGVTKTDMFDLMSSGARDRLIDTSAFKRAAEPEEIANVALFFASDLSRFVTGQTLRVDGGMV